MYENKRICEDAARGRDEVAGQSEPVGLKSCLIRVQAAPQRSVVSCGPSGDVLADGYCVMLPSGNVKWMEKTLFEDNVFYLREEDVPEALMPEGGCPGGMSFAGAISCIRDGRKVRRAGWPEEAYVFLADDVEFHAAAQIAVHETDCQVEDVLVMHSRDYSFRPGWVPSQEDMLADDWEVVE